MLIINLGDPGNADMGRGGWGVGCGSADFLSIDYCPWLPCLSLEPSDGPAMLQQFPTWPIEGTRTLPMVPSQPAGSTASKKNPADLRGKGELMECYG